MKSVFGALTLVLFISFSLAWAAPAAAAEPDSSSGPVFTSWIDQLGDLSAWLVELVVGPPEVEGEGGDPPAEGDSEDPDLGASIDPTG